MIFRWLCCCLFWSAFEYCSIKTLFFRCCYQLRTEVRFFQHVKFPVKINLQFSLKIDSEHSLILLFAKFGLNFIAHSSLFRFFAQKNIKKHILTSVWSANAGQNIQHSVTLFHLIWIQLHFLDIFYLIIVFYASGKRECLFWSFYFMPECKHDRVAASKFSPYFDHGSVAVWPQPQI